MKNVTRLARMLMVALSALLMTSGVWAQTTLLTESFNGGVMPTGWTQTIVTGTTNWVFNAVGNNSTQPATTHSGAYNALLKYSGKGQKNDLVTPAINFTGLPIGTLSFWHTQAIWPADQDSLTVFYRTSATDTWKKIGQYTASITAWTQESISLPNPSATYELKFRGNAEWGYGVCLDDVLVQGMTAPPAPPVTITIGTGTTTTGTYPYNTFWMDDKTQIIYTAAEIDALGGAAGNITNFGLNISTAANYLMNGFTIQMAHTTSTALSGFESPTWTTVYSSAMTIASTGWQNIALSTPFVWNGTDNLLVQICYHNTSYGSTSYVYTTTQTTAKVYQHYQDNGTGCTMSTGVTAMDRPNVRLTMAPKAGTLVGNITSSFNGSPLNPASINIQTNNFPAFSNGSYMINYMVGTYNVTASAPGYLPKTKTSTIAQNMTTTTNFALDPIPAVITGIVTNAANGNPVVGATITFGSASTQSIAGGVYTLNIYPGGVSGTIGASKLGFDNYVSASITPTPPNTYTQNIALMENINVPGAVTATLNAGQTAVDLSWGIPVGNYMLIYDDGVAENFAIWATAGNKNATKFTPVSYPAKLTGGKVNIGTADNYPAGANPFSGFQIAVLAADGPGGTPGTELVAPFTVTASAYGFVNFPIPSTTITSGSFYIVMIQGGTAPNTPGVAVDTTTQQLRSYSQFGSGPWIPASGNFMIRANMQGAGGPLLSDNSGTIITASAVEGLIYQTKPSTVSGVEGAGQVVFENGDSPESITGYQVYRLKQGEEGTPAVWTSIGTPAVTNMVDPSWPSLACGPYRWGVQALYTGNRVSSTTFSNVLGKCWTATVTFNLDLSCDSVTPANTKIVLQNTAYPDTVYTKYSDASGVVIFNNVWKGNYNYTISKFGYIAQTAPLVVLGDVVVNSMLLQVKTPPTGLTVDDHSLFAEWVAPVSSTPLFTEKWASGSFATNQWVTAGGTNWRISTTNGNPAPSAEFYYSPVVSNYSITLTSKNITGVNSPVLKLNYDIFLNNYGNTTLEQMAVELWDGATWHTLKNYDNSSGADIAWTSETLDISAYTGGTFKIRFRAYGEDSNNIDNWNIDNISVEARGPEGVDPCLIAYNFYLNAVQVATLAPTQTTYQIPPSVVHYGTVYNACVLAVYGSGYSTQSCYTFTSRFLYPPTNIQGEGIESAAYITWEKPVVSDNDSPIHVPAFRGVVDHTTPSAGPAPATAKTSTTNNDSPLGSIAFGFDGIGLEVLDFDVDNVGGATVIAPNPAPDFMNGFAMPVGETAWTYATVYGVNNLYKVDRATGALTTVGSVGKSFNDLTVDPTTNIIYGTDGTSLYSIDPTVPSATLIGAHGASANLMIGLACDGAGDLWAYDIGNDLFFSVDKTTGVALTVGPIGFNANYAQSMFYDPATATITMAAYNLTTSGTEIRAVDVTTGASVVLSSASGVEMTASVLPITSGGGGGTPDGLMGYNVYRDGAFRHFVNSPDTLHYYDFNLEPGTYCYDVSAKYDLTDYGFPGQFDESLVASNGPVCVEIIYGRPLPFYEPWSGGTFAFNGWTTAGANWSVNAGLGNPAPAADFSWQPIVNNYSQSMETPVLNAASFSCANIWLDFDLKLADRNSTGDEKIIVDIYSGGTWTTKAEFANTASMNWTGQHIDLKAYAGKAFKVRFTAAGKHSDDILHWYVDNINVYGICKAPGFAPANVTQSQFTTTLTWTAPVCAVPMQLVKLFQWEGTPDNGYFQSYAYGYGVVYDLTTYPDAVLAKIDFHHASWGTVGTWNYMIHVVDWGTYTEVAAIGPLTTTGDDKWEENILLGDIQGMGGHQVGIILEPMSNSATDAYPDFSSDNIGPDGVSVFGPLADYSAMAPSAIGDFLQNLWISVPMEDAMATLIPRKITVGELQNANATRVATTSTPVDYLMTNQFATLLSPSDSSHVMGYNVYVAEGTGAFVKNNTAPVNALTYNVIHDVNTPLNTPFKYFVTALFEDSQNPGPVICEPSSDTVTISWPAVGVIDHNSSSISLYPNPATEYVNVVSTSDIKTVEVINFLGQTIYKNTTVNGMTLKLDVQRFQTGVYFVKVATAQGNKTTKITVTK